MKKFNLNKKNFYVKKLGAVRFWNKNEEFRFKKNQSDIRNRFKISNT